MEPIRFDAENPTAMLRQVVEAINELIDTEARVNQRLDALKAQVDAALEETDEEIADEIEEDC